MNDMEPEMKLLEEGWLLPSAVAYQKSSLEPVKKRGSSLGNREEKAPPFAASYEGCLAYMVEPSAR